MLTVLYYTRASFTETLQEFTPLRRGGNLGSGATTAISIRKVKRGDANVRISL
jgi:hypothetical protein